MNRRKIRTTIYFENDLHTALIFKSGITGQTISDIVNALIRESLLEDEVDLKTFQERLNEPTVDYESFLSHLKADGKL